MAGREDARVDEFLDKYKRLEEVVRTAYHLESSKNPIYELKSRSKSSREASALDYCREVRNFLQHTPKVDGAYAVVPSDEMVAFIDKLIGRIVKRPKAIDVMVHSDRIVSCAPTDTVRDVITKMKESGHSTIPVLDDGHVVGMFDRDTVFLFATENPGKALPEDALVSEMSAYTSLDNRKSEVFTFHAKDVYVDEIEQAFEAHSALGRRVSMAFITEHGKRDERIIGLLTAWDVIAVKGE